MRKIFTLFIILTTGKAVAQLPEDALRTAWFSQNGTARNIAIGGVMTSLGGDISANHINPAGIGLYKTCEFVVSPGFNLLNNKFAYRGSDTSLNKNNFQYGTSGIILGGINTTGSKWVSSAFSLSVNQLASYNNHVQYSGFNNYSSFSEQYLEELIRDRADTNAALSNYIFGSSLAFRTYLIDTLSGPGGTVAGYQSLVPISTGVKQYYDVTTKGGYHEIAIGYASNMQDKFYLGGSLTIPIISYQKDFYYSEKDATNNPNNEFAYFNYHEKTKSTGWGLGLKMGIIYKPAQYWRLGFAVHTPQWINFKDEIRAWMTTNTESYAGTVSESSDNLNGNKPGTREYNLLSPWRAIASASYVIREIKDTKKQRGYISADIEYVNYRGARFGATSSDNNDQTLKDYYSMLNNTIKEYYKSNFNFKIGGELKFDPWMFRLGFAYYGSPYADANLKANKLIPSGGVGYRNHGFFIDLGYAYTLTKDVNFPYMLNDKANTFAVQTGNRQQLMITFGIKF